jgi:hypothetical protein
MSTSFLSLYRLLVRMNNEIWETYIYLERESGREREKENESLSLILEGEKDKRSMAFLPSTFENKRMAYYYYSCRTLIYSFSILINETTDIKMT